MLQLLVLSSSSHVPHIQLQADLDDVRGGQSGLPRVRSGRSSKSDRWLDFTLHTRLISALDSATQPMLEHARSDPVERLSAGALQYRAL